MSDELKGAPDWIVTFTDMMGLLLTFFILLLTFSTLERDKFYRAVGSLDGAFRAVTLSIDKPLFVGRNQVNQSRYDIQGMLSPPDREPPEAPLIKTALALKRALGEEVEPEMLRQGFRIRIAADTGFEPGSARLTPAGARVLDAVARAVAPLPNPIRVDGHTDDRFAPSAEHPSAWHLSAERAVAAARRLAKAGPVAPERLSVAAYADLRPIARGASEAARALNRRVDITVLATSLRGK